MLFLQGGLLVWSLAQLRSVVDRRFGQLVGACFLLLTALQFHLPFYMSRPLPNVMALAVTNLGLADWLAGGRPLRAVALLTFATVGGAPGLCSMLEGSSSPASRI